MVIHGQDGLCADCRGLCVAGVTPATRRPTTALGLPSHSRWSARKGALLRRLEKEPRGVW
jgi:hypothetical protein